jgi:hypothetical protein
MKKFIGVTITIFFLICLSACGKSEIDKCVDSIMLQKFASHSFDACWDICLNSRTFEQMSEEDKSLMVNGCFVPCSDKAEKRDDVRKYIQVKYEADIRLQCLRASSGNK